MWDILKKLIREIREDGLFDTAASVAFWLLLSLPAILLAGLSSISLLGEDLTEEFRKVLIEFIERVFASEAEPLTDSVNNLFNSQRPGVLSGSIAVALFSASRGFAGLIRALDEVYDVEDTRNFVHTRVLALGLSIGTFATGVAAGAFWFISRDAGVPVAIVAIVTFAVLVVWAATLLHIGPTHHTPWRYDLPGAVVTAVGWLVLSLGFGWYIRLLGSDSSNDLLGATGALLLGLTWMWAACVVFLAAGELNQIIAERAGVIGPNRSVVSRFPRRRAGIDTSPAEATTTSPTGTASSDSPD